MSASVARRVPTSIPRPVILAGGVAAGGVVSVAAEVLTPPWPDAATVLLAVGVGLSAFLNLRLVRWLPRSEREWRTWVVRLGLLTAWASASVLLDGLAKGPLLALVMGARLPGWAALLLPKAGWLGREGVVTQAMLIAPAVLLYGYVFLLVRLGYLAEVEAVLPARDVEPEGLDLVLCRDRESHEPVVWREEDRYTHLSIVGPPGSGKSVLLQQLAAQGLAREDEGLVSVDTKGDLHFEPTRPYGAPGLLELSRHYGRRVYVVAPGRPESAVFNPLGGGVEAAAQATVSALMMLQRLTGSTEAYFSTVGQAVLEHAIHLVKLLDDPNPSLWRLRNVLTDEDELLSALDQLGERFGVEVGRPARDASGRITAPGVVVPARDVPEIVLDTLRFFLVTDYFNPGSEIRFHFQGTRLALDTFFRSAPLMEILTPKPGRPSVDLDRVLEGPDVLLVSLGQGVPGVGPELAAVLGRLFLVHLEHAVFRRPIGRRPMVQVQLDEFAQYVTDTFPVLLQQARSYGVSIVLAYQGHSQLVAFRDRAFADTVSAQARSRILFGGLSASDVEYFIRHFGTKMGERVSTNIRRSSRSVSLIPESTGAGETITEREEDYIPFNELRYLPANHVVYEVMRERSVQRAGFGLVEALRPTELPAKRSRTTPSPPEREVPTPTDLGPEAEAASGLEMRPKASWRPPGRATPAPQACEGAKASATPPVPLLGPVGEGATSPPRKGVREHGWFGRERRPARGQDGKEAAHAEGGAGDSEPFGPGGSGASA